MYTIMYMQETGQQDAHRGSRTPQEAQQGAGTHRSCSHKETEDPSTPRGGDRHTAKFSDPGGLAQH